MSELSIDFVSVAQRYAELSKAQQAELRRIRSPDDLLLEPAFYRLLVGVKPDKRWQRIVYLLPWVKHAAGSTSLGKQLAGVVNERRLFQVIRSDEPNDLIQLRRLVQQIEPVVDWQEFGKFLYFWGDQSKRQLLENYFINLPLPKKD